MVLARRRPPGSIRRRPPSGIPGAAGLERIDDPMRVVGERWVLDPWPTRRSACSAIEEGAEWAAFGLLHADRRRARSQLIALRGKLGRFLILCLSYRPSSRCEVRSGWSPICPRGSALVGVLRALAYPLSLHLSYLRTRPRVAPPFPRSRASVVVAPRHRDTATPRPATKCPSAEPRRHRSTRNRPDADQSAGPAMDKPSPPRYAAETPLHRGQLTLRGGRSSGRRRIRPSPRLGHDPPGQGVEDHRPDHA